MFHTSIVQSKDDILSMIREAEETAETNVIYAFNVMENVLTVIGASSGFFVESRYAYKGAELCERSASVVAIIMSQFGDSNIEVVKRWRAAILREKFRDLGGFFRDQQSKLMILHQD